MNLLITSIRFARLKNSILAKFRFNNLENQHKKPRKWYLRYIFAKKSAGIWKRTWRSGRGLILSDNNQTGGCSMKNENFRCLKYYFVKINQVVKILFVVVMIV